MRTSAVAFLTTVFPIKEEYLHDFFMSLEQQTYKNFDLIVVNDGFVNFSKFAKQYTSLKIIELNYSSTPAKNREHGINYCIESGYDILIFGDCDDYFEVNRIEKSLWFLEKNEIVVNDLSLFDESGVYAKNYLSHRLSDLEIIDFDYIQDKNIFGMTNTAIKLGDIEKVHFDDDLLIVDWFLYKNLLQRGLKAIFTNQTISYYRQHKNNVLGLTPKQGKYFLWGEEK